MKKIVFIEPKSPSLHIFSVFGIPRLGTVLLGTILKEQGYEVTVYIEEISEIDFSDVLSADLVGISTITSTAPRAYELARQIKAHGVPVLMGGPHVTFLPEEALEHCDYVLCGEAEKSILPFVDAIKAGEGFESVPGLIYRDDGQLIKNPRLQQRVDLAENPIPDLNLIAKFQAHKGLSFRRIVPIQTSRGCPYDCTFCSVTQMFGRRMRYRSIDSVIEELKQYDPKTDFIFFYDDNFVVKKERATELMNRMIDEDLGFQWSAQTRIDIGKDKQLLRLMRQSGCVHVYIGLETIDDKTLSMVHKSQTKSEMTKAIRTIQRHKIGVHGMFVFGFDTDTVQSTRATCEFAMKQRIKTVQYLILTPLPGTQVYEDYKNSNRLIIKDWSFYDGHHVVHAPERMSPMDLQYAQVRAHRRYYSLGERIRSWLRLDIYRAFAQNYAKRNGRRWLRENRYYMKAIKLQNRTTKALARHSTNLVIKLDLRTTYNDIKERIESALASLRKPADQA